MKFSGQLVNLKNPTIAEKGIQNMEHDTNFKCMYIKYYIYRSIFIGTGCVQICDWNQSPCVVPKRALPTNINWDHPARMWNTQQIVTRASSRKSANASRPITWLVASEEDVYLLAMTNSLLLKIAHLLLIHVDLQKNGDFPVRKLWLCRRHPFFSAKPTSNDLVIAGPGTIRTSQPAIAALLQCGTISLHLLGTAMDL